MPAQTAAFGIGFELKHGFIKLPVVGVLADALVIDLRRHDDEHAKDQWYEQTLVAVFAKLAGGARAECNEGARSRNEKQQLHAEVVRPDHPILKGGGEFVVFYVPAPVVEPHAGVEEKEYNNGDYAQPVEVVPAFEGSGFSGDHLFYFLGKETATGAQGKAVFIDRKADFIKSNTVCWCFPTFWFGLVSKA